MTDSRWNMAAWAGRSEARARRIYLLAGCLAIAGFFLVVLVRREPSNGTGKDSGLRAIPSPALLDATRRVPRTFPDALVDSISRDGHLTVTVHVALADRSSGAASRFADGSQPRTNLTWGALYGVETHFANAAGWRRACTDNGDGPVLRRVVFHRRAEVTAAWRELGVAAPFDIFVLALAWPSTLAREAMNRPIREAMLHEPIPMTVEGEELVFGSGSMLIGYLGPNAMAEGYWDPFEQLPGTCPRQPTGIFYLCSMSAVYLHDTVVRHGLYPVLFAREPIVPEAYLLDGMLQALAVGELDDGFLLRAAEQYTIYQKSISPDRARRMLFR